MENHGEGLFLGKYIGYIRDTNDPEKRGRLRCYCPEVTGSTDNQTEWLDWALPCFPWFASQGVGDNFVPPKQGEWAVWLEFRHGDPRFPVWVGVFPNNAEIDKTKTVLRASERINLGENADQQLVLGTRHKATLEQLADQVILPLQVLTAWGISSPASAVPTNVTNIAAFKQRLPGDLSDYVYTKKSAP